jgi:hypothetical protein
MTLSNGSNEEGNEIKNTAKFLQEFINFSEQDIPPNWVNYMTASTLGLQAITIGFTLSIGPWYIMTQF